MQSINDIIIHLHINTYIKVVDDQEHVLAHRLPYGDDPQAEARAACNSCQRSEKGSLSHALDYKKEMKAMLENAL